MNSNVRVAILMLHKIAKAPVGTHVPAHYVEPALFERQMRLFRRLGYQSVSLNALFTEPLPPKPLVVTFDDGYANFATNALPILARVGFGATVFLVSNQIGGTNEWDHRGGDVVEPLLAADEIRECHRQGIEFGSHTLDHADLVAVSPEEARRQIEGSRKAIGDLLGEPVHTFCYPYGRMTPAIEGMVRDAGYRLACSVRGGFNTPATSRYSLNRINLRSDTTVPVLLYKLLRDRIRAV